MPSLFHRLLPGEDVQERPAPAAEVPASAEPESAGDMISSQDLPPASDELAALFPEEAPAEAGEPEANPSAETEPEIADTPGQVEAVAEAPPPQEPKPARKRRGILSWLFGPSDPDDSHAESSTARMPEPISTLTEVGTAASAPEVTEEPVPAGASVELRSEAHDEPAEPISASELPSAGEILAEIFPADAAPAEPEEVSADEAEPSVTTQAYSPIVTEATSEESEGENSDTSESEEVVQPAPEAPAVEETAQAEPEPADFASEDRLEMPEAAAPAEPAVPQPAAYRDWALDEKLASHREWIDSRGRSGNRADLSGAELEAADLISVNLRMADLHDANLRAADLLLADLRDACLVRADLEETCLVGANLEGANLEGATLETAMGLVPRQLAGANLRDALLAPQLMEFEAESRYARNATQSHRYFGVMTVVSLLSWLLLWKTKDAQLVSDSAILPFLHSRAAAAALPTAESYLVIPAVLFILYLLFHYHLQRLWESVEELPAIFPDGHALGDEEPSIILGLLRTHFRWMNPDPTSTRLVERAISILLAYGVVPATLLGFWTRYLTRQEIHGTILLAALSVVAGGISLYAVTKVGRHSERWEFEKRWTRRVVKKFRALNVVSVTAVFGAILILVSIGTIFGVPHEKARAPQFRAENPRRWAPTAFWWLGYEPFADLTEASLSSRPATWNVADDQVQSIDGARLNGAHLRYAQAYGVFLANAHLLHSDLQGAFLSQADLRGADLGQSRLRYAVLDQARMYHVNLDRSSLDEADLRRADLRGANLSHSSAVDTILEDARLDAASLYSARLDGAVLNRANMEKADLRDAYLAGAHMDHADLQGAYLWSAKLTGADLGGAQFGSAILIDADLRGANLGGAQFAATVLNNTELSGTTLDGADMRGALGLTAAQVCSAKSRRGLALDDALAMQVAAQCGGTQ